MLWATLLWRHLLRMINSLLARPVQEPDFRPLLSDAPWFVALGTTGVAIPQATIFIGNHLAGAAYSGIFSESPIFERQMWSTSSCLP